MTGDPNAGLEAELRALMERADPVPAEVTEFARAALGWRRLDAELAELLADSALDAETALARCEEAQVRWVTFRADGLSIELRIEPAGETRTLLGQLAPPPAAAAVEVQDAGGGVVASAPTDGLGRFRLALAAPGRIRLRVVRTDPAGPAVETSWLTV